MPESESAPGWLWVCVPTFLLVFACAGTAGFLAMSSPVEFNSIISGVTGRVRDVVLPRSPASPADALSPSGSEQGRAELEIAGVGKPAADELPEEDAGSFRQHLNPHAMAGGEVLPQLGGAPGLSLYSMLGQGRFSSGASQAEQVESGFAALEVAVIPEPTSTLGLGAVLAFLIVASQRLAVRRSRCLAHSLTAA